MTPEQEERTLRAFRKAGSASGAAKLLGMSASGVRERLRNLGISPAANYNRIDPEIPDTPPPKPRHIVRAYSSHPDGEPERVCILADTHLQPGLDSQHLTWIARHVAETKPDRILHLGDLGEFASCSRHEPPGSLMQKTRPSYKNDLEAIEEGLARIHAEIGTAFPIHLTMGNHCVRPLIFETGTAELEGALWPQFTDLLGRYNWRHTDYRQFLFIGGVGCTHVPQTLVERPYGGKYMNSIATDLVFSLAFGHRHRFDFMSVPKIGPQQRIEILNPGCAMPTGYFPSYNASQQGGTTWGICDATFHGGHITSHHFIPMTHLESRYA